MPPRLKLRLSRPAELAVKKGHPWVFSESIRDQNREGSTGEMAVIYDSRDAFLAAGLYDPHSPIRLRVLHLGKGGGNIDAAWWQNRLQQAEQRRAGLFDAQTNGYRIVSGESDGFPGLVADRYASVLVLKLYSSAWLPRFAEIRTLFSGLHGTTSLVLRLSRNIQDIARQQFSLEEGLVSGSLPPQVVFQENGLSFEADVLKGQKTGFFLDQRENRQRIEALARGRQVLNAFSFSGGFSLYAARGGARSVTDLDISAHALDSSRRNFALNPDISTPHDQIQADAFAWMESGPRRAFDLIVTDPPSLAKRETEREGAIQAYGRLNAAAIQRLTPRGILVAASCSAHVSLDEFLHAVTRVGKKSGRDFAVQWTSSHPADHPATFPEANYLKCVCLEFA